MSETVENWEEISREEVFKEYGRGIEKRVYRLPHGKEADFYLNTGGNCVACLALTRDNQVILVKQFRPGPSKVLIEIPGGGLKDGEDKKEAMERELLEETGYKGNLQFVVSSLPSAYATYQKHFFVVTECEQLAKPKLEDNGESVEVALFSLDEFRSHIQSGQMTDIEGAYICLDYLKLL